MKKSTIVVIIAIYLLSIVLISFLGIKVRVYDEVKYVQEISVSVEAENEDWYVFKSKGKNSDGDNLYSLTIRYQYAVSGSYQVKDGVTIDGNAVVVSLIPHIMYDTNEEGNATGESIKYSIGNQNYENKGYIYVSEMGFITAFRKGISTDITIQPVSTGRLGSKAIITVLVN